MLVPVSTSVPRRTWSGCRCRSGCRSSWRCSWGCGVNGDCVRANQGDGVHEIQRVVGGHFVQHQGARREGRAAPRESRRAERPTEGDHDGTPLALKPLVPPVICMLPGALPPVRSRFWLVSNTPALIVRRLAVGRPTPSLARRTPPDRSPSWHRLGVRTVENQQAGTGLGNTGGAAVLDHAANGERITVDAARLTGSQEPRST